MKEMSRGLIVACFGVMGILGAAIAKMLYDGGTGVTALANMGLTITEVMVVIIVLFVLVGIVLGVAKS